MTKYISILRGINVGGHRKILMADLKALYKKLGYSNIITYIQSGNVIFDSTKKENHKEIGQNIAQAIHKTYGYDVPVIVRSLEEIEQVIATNPFLSDDTDINKLYLTFLDEIPSPENVEKAMTFEFPPDKFEIIGKNVFIHFSGKSSDSKITNNFFEKKLKVTATTRNWKTVRKLSELGKEK